MLDKKEIRLDGFYVEPESAGEMRRLARCNGDITVQLYKKQSFFPSKHHTWEYSQPMVEISKEQMDFLVMHQRCSELAIDLFQDENCFLLEIDQYAVEDKLYKIKINFFSKPEREAAITFCGGVPFSVYYYDKETGDHISWSGSENYAMPDTFSDLVKFTNRF